MGHVSHDGRISRTRRPLLDGMNASRTDHVRAWFRGGPGHLGPNPDQLVAGLVGVLLIVGVALLLLAFAGQV